MVMNGVMGDLSKVHASGDVSKVTTLGGSEDEDEDEDEVDLEAQAEEELEKQSAKASFRGGQVLTRTQEESVPDVFPSSPSSLSSPSSSKSSRRYNSDDGEGNERSSQRESHAEGPMKGQRGRSSSEVFRSKLRLRQSQAAASKSGTSNKGHRIGFDPDVVNLYTRFVSNSSASQKQSFRAGKSSSQGLPTEQRSVPYSEILHITRQFEKIGGRNGGGFVMEPKVTCCSVRILSITDINVINGTFRVEGQIDVRWYDEKLVDREFNSIVPVEDVDTLIGQPFIKNTGGDMTVSPGMAGIAVQTFPTDPPGLCRYFWNFNGICTEMFQLEQFPFDYQDLTVDVCFFSTGVPSSKSFGRIILPETQWDIDNNLRKGAFWRYGLESNSLLEWDMFEPHVTVSGGQNQSHDYIFKAQILRKYRYFAINVMFATGLISTLAFTCFAVPQDTGLTGSTVGRLQIIAAYLLTVVAFKFVIADSLPKVSYMTVLDIYFVFVMVYNILLSVAVSALAMTHSTRETEYLVGVSMLAVWVVIHVIFVYRCLAYVSQLRKALGRPIPSRRRRRPNTKQTRIV
jgi:hypothetical protein